ncbi:MAG: Uncharacterized nucleoside diphosphate sugar transferase SCO3743 [uncultured Nocardioides sp.]|uniref:Uncharacterized nucleoside diphosphate sugar transferase SCO3743 n=1 Tax=uncultured Nocardioides sp. TaxID=198441 RepID=A0A6J4NHP5_9ACTN|nr:MAG: Uncharacterized nucleoside diphosphate sugar transferase SCO3743 [uncultured Nocardioides sp.]
MKLLLVAKAPVAGRVKTRLGALVGYDVAADLAAAALLDTIDACHATGAARHLSLAGDLSAAVRGEEIRSALDGWTITPQVGEGFADRLVRAHLDAGPRIVVQIGMDTPQVTAADLHEVADLIAGHDAVLAPATDGGWWALARRDANVVRHLAQVSMSTSTTCADTWRALERAGARVAQASALTDVDTLDDAELVAGLAPATRFAEAWRAVRAEVTW